MMSEEAPGGVDVCVVMFRIIFTCSERRPRFPLPPLGMAPPTTRYAVLREDGEVGDDGEEPSVSGALAEDADDTPDPFWDEARGQLSLALPVSLSMVCNRVMSLTSVAFVGHLGALPLAAAALATTLGNVTGNSIMVGMASASSTIGGQAFGAKRYATLGSVLQRCLLILTIAGAPIAATWTNAEAVLLRLGQDPDIARLSGVYMRCLIPGLFFYAWNISTQAYMQSQRITKPGAVAGVVAAIIHVPMNYLFIHAFGWGYAGAGLATSWSNGVVLSINVAYLCFFKDKSLLKRGGRGDVGAGQRARASEGQAQLHRRRLYPRSPPPATSPELVVKAGVYSILKQPKYPKWRSRSGARPRFCPGSGLS